MEEKTLDMLETLEEINKVRLNFSESNVLWLNIAVAFIMFGVALELNLRDFKQLMIRPRAVFVGIASQFLLLPLFTFIIIVLFKNHITLTVGLGMALVAACPGGNVSNFFSALARGNIALSVGLTAFSSIAGLFMTPFLFSFWGSLTVSVFHSGDGTGLMRHLPIDPLNVFLTVLLILGLPLVLGIMFKNRFPQTTYKILPTTKRLSIIIFLSIVAIIFVKNFDLFLKYIPYIFILVLIHNGTALALGFFSGKIFKLPHRDCKTLSVETGIQNSGLALALLFNPLVFPPEMEIGGMTFIAAWWGVWHLLAGLIISGFWSGFKVSPEHVQIK